MDLPELLKPNGIYISDHHSIMDLGNTIVYTGESIIALREAVDGYFKAVEDAMEKRLDQVRIQLQQAEKQLSNAEEALSSCKSSRTYYEDEDEDEPDCSCEERDVAEARDEVNRIQEIIKKLECIKSDVEREIYEYRQPFGIITPGGGDGVLASLSENYTKTASERISEILDIFQEYQNVRIIKNGDSNYVPDSSEPIEQTCNKAEEYREASKRILQKQHDDDYGSRQINIGNVVALCPGCHRPIVACICPNGSLQRERIFNYESSR